MLNNYILKMSYFHKYIFFFIKLEIALAIPTLDEWQIEKGTIQ